MAMTNRISPRGSPGGAPQLRRAELRWSRMRGGRMWATSSSVEGSVEVYWRMAVMASKVDCVIYVGCARDV
eukprot:12203705-Alexandrium_andersonii.AAC.1